MQCTCIACMRPSFALIPPGRLHVHVQLTSPCIACTDTMLHTQDTTGGICNVQLMLTYIACMLCVCVSSIRGVGSAIRRNAHTELSVSGLYVPSMRFRLVSKRACKEGLPIRRPYVQHLLCSNCTYLTGGFTSIQRGLHGRGSVQARLLASAHTVALPPQAPCHGADSMLAIWRSQQHSNPRALVLDKLQPMLAVPRQTVQAYVHP